MSTLFYVFYGLLYDFKKRRWAERVLRMFVHRAWMAAYQPNRDPNGSWKWYRELSN